MRFVFGVVFCIINWCFEYDIQIRCLFLYIWSWKHVMFWKSKIIKSVNHFRTKVLWGYLWDFWVLNGPLTSLKCCMLFVVRRYCCLLLLLLSRKIYGYILPVEKIWTCTPEETLLEIETVPSTTFWHYSHSWNRKCAPNHFLIRICNGHMGTGRTPQIKATERARDQHMASISRRRGRLLQAT